MVALSDASLMPQGGDLRNFQKIPGDRCVPVNNIMVNKPRLASTPLAVFLAPTETSW